MAKFYRPHYGPGVHSACNRNEYQGYSLRGKGGRCAGPTTLPHSCADRLEILAASLSWGLYRSSFLLAMVSASESVGHVPQTGQPASIGSPTVSLQFSARCAASLLGGSTQRLLSTCCQWTFYTQSRSYNSSVSEQTFYGPTTGGLGFSSSQYGVR